MPDIKLRNQPFDLVFHPSEPVVYGSLLTGEVKSWKYDDATGETSRLWTVRPTKKTARALAVEGDGKAMWMGGKSGVLCRMDATMGTVLREHEQAHDSPVNRIICVNETLTASGDDEGVIKFWDPRTPECVREYRQHFDYISGFTYFDDKRQLVTTSGDGFLSVIDIRSKKKEPLHMSDDQEDELLSICQIKGGQRFVVGGGLGTVSVWDRKLGYGDSVDRIVGHPASVDAVVALTDDIIATGSEDGMVRVIQIQPNSFLGVIATHDEYPIERLALDRNKKWLGSVSHDECIKLTDVENIFEDAEDDGDVEAAADSEDVEMGAEKEGRDDEDSNEEGEGEDEEMEEDSDEDSDDDRRSKKKNKKNPMGDFGRSARENDNAGFFDDL